MTHEEFTAHPAHPSTEDHDDTTVEAHYSGLERPHACYEGVVYLGHLVVGDDGEETEIFDAVPCRRCVVTGGSRGRRRSPGGHLA